MRRKPGRPFDSGALRTATDTGLGRIFSHVVRRVLLGARAAQAVANAEGAGRYC